uniref:CUB domain-containing protein n=1 Tax=Plectus sambesii TaxID=2011161 RepID=A0A914VZ47_9BILA
MFLRGLILIVFWGHSIVADQQVIVCNETSADAPIPVSVGDRIALETQNYPDGYPNVSCGVILRPENDVIISVVFEYFLLYPNDTLIFANSANETFASLSGNEWMNQRNFLFTMVPRQDADERLHLNLIVQDAVQFGGFRAWVIGYDKMNSSANSNCGTNITLNAGESYIYLPPPSPAVQEFNSSNYCLTTVAPADPHIRFRAIVNYLDMNKDDMIYVYDGPNYDAWLADMTERSYSRITEIIKNARLPIQFQLYQREPSFNQSSYFIIVQAYFNNEPTCPDSERKINLVGEGNLTEPFYITTTEDNFTTNYKNNLKCSWTVRVPYPVEYAIAVWFRVFQTEEGIDQLEITHSNPFERVRYSGALVAKNGVPLQNENTPPLLFTSSNVDFSFTSDYIRTGIGMRLEVRALPINFSPISRDPVNIVDAINFTTPGYPYAYGRNQDVEWRFDGGKGYVLSFKIINENAGDMLFDSKRNASLTIYNGPFDASSELKSFNKFTKNESDQGEVYREIRTTQQYLIVRFTTEQYRVADNPSENMGISFTVDRMLDDGSESSPSSLASTTPGAGTESTQPGEGSATPPTTTNTGIPSITTITATTTTEGNKDRGNSAQSHFPDCIAVIMAMMFLISSITVHCC